VSFLEIFEAQEMKNIIVAQTSLRWIQNNERQRLSQRIRTLVGDPRKQSVVFSNENFRATFVTRRKDESADQRDFRANFEAAAYYRRHLNGATPVVLVSDLPDQPPVTMVDGVFVLGMEKYMELFWPQHPTLTDLFSYVKEAIAREEVERKVRSELGGNEFGYTEHLTAGVLEAEVKSGVLFRGRMKVSDVNAQDEATVATSSDHGVVLISGMADRNRAVHGDVVVVELLPEAGWKAPLRMLRLKNEPSETSASSAPDIARGAAVVPTGRVVGVLQRNWRPYVVTLEEGDQGSGHILAIPLDYKIPKIRVRINEIARLQTQRLVVRIDSWPVSSQSPAGHLVRTLGEIRQKETEVAAILVEHEIEVPPFSEAVLATLPRDTREDPWRVTPADVAERRDLRQSHFICSIDPLGSEDIDDALSVRLLPNGNFELGVHIADVTHFVQPESPCDIEGRARGTSVYLSDRRFNMLPTVLSERLCSLRGEVDRFAVSVLSELTPSGEMVGHWFGKTIMRSAKEMYYEQAQAILEGQPADHEYLRSLDASFLKKARIEIPRLAQVADLLRDQRLARGALELDGAEIRFSFDQNKDVAGVLNKTSTEIHKVVAECMIFANGVVASQIARVFPSCALLRKHPKPQPGQFSALLKCVASRGLEVSTTSNKALGESLARIAATCDADITALLRTMTTTGLSEAEYFSTGSVPVDDFFHYGLALDHYTHFTSPIRRYADCIVHWQLIASVQQETGQKIDPRLRNSVLKPSWVDEVAEHLNAKNRNSKKAQEDSTELFEVLYIMHETASNRVLELTGIISDIRANAFMVFIPKLGLRTILYLRDKAGSLILSPRFLGDQKAPLEAAPIPGSLVTTDSTATISIATGGTHEFRLLDKIRVALTLSPSHAHLANIVVELVGSVAEGPPAMASTSKTSLLLGGAPVVAGSKGNAAGEKMLTKSDLSKAIDKTEANMRRGLEVRANEDEGAEFRQTPDSKSIYQVLERMRGLSLQ